MNKIFIATALTLVAILAGVAFLYKPSTPFFNQPIPVAPTPDTENINEDNLDQQTRYMDIESFVRTNIGTISPVAPVLGGTFFVTAIQTSSSTGTVEYEDGHILIVADFAYTIEEDGRPVITSFVPREE